MFSCAGRWTLFFGGILLLGGWFVGGHWREKDKSSRDRWYRFWLVVRSLGAEKSRGAARRLPARSATCVFRASARLIPLPHATYF